MNFPDANIADRLSVYPVAQQVVGALTIGSNLAKMSVDVVKSVYNVAVNILSKLFSEPEAFKEKFSASTDYTEHFRFIVIGAIRMIPVLGTLYSKHACDNQQMCADLQRRKNSDFEEMLAENKRAREKYESMPAELRVY